jgi:hypothetical protein
MRLSSGEALSLYAVKTRTAADIPLKKMSAAVLVKVGGL